MAVSPHRRFDHAYQEAALHDAVDGLRERAPISSASVAFTPGQRTIGLSLLALLIVCGVLLTVPTLVLLTLLSTLAYVATMVDRLVLFYRGLDDSTIIRISDEDARAIPDEDLPTYTILVPAYDEAEVIGQVVANMEALEYPADKLEVLLLLEADDESTIAAAEKVCHGTVTRILTVPAAEPRTKPKACNYGMHFSDGEIVTIYDAEDGPDPLQLRRVVAAFRRLPENTACVQSKLAFHNGSQNLLTAWFTADYALWFSFILPGLMRSSSPIPLGGTSNHLRRSVLDRIGTWDPYNVTEDADLGVRIAESGYRTAVLDSTTLEEANSDTINWIRQRSRWYKGYLQTWLVHMRRPRHLLRALGPMGFFRFTALMAGTPVIACLNMVFWLITLSWILGQPALIQQQFPPYVYFPALISLVFGNMAVLYMNVIACRETRNSALLVASLTSPLYWVLMSIAAIKGTYQLLRNPSYWEKTAHGLPGTGNDTPSGGPA
ncbi:glycosyltransferase [Rhodococcus triatomae]|uniref:Glycosyltransferase, catalytic subunit of cellulose synthase and poly-beta-1,6-N-acetylglucosamine synthase n=1 Tax=Rhodococcus triatomae TaxID=300028 RepID=A0A1G8H6L2_9NOCA|nr:glycosyltransferase [Rhodococcus triatomae]QNG20194.1 glycosyltransferase [Rhodococcus triatomae]QNG23891.1 glycosyltransferase [Rhodococcus triatomae]SDI02170.1 Glycosyltransferase, catalytic subunit of cellulose synthase and poly-beta-1,6-N-acetylglucosamine synthase [Rhodococcus triatomae]